MSLSPVVIQFLSKGLGDVTRAFRSVEQTFTQSQRSIGRTADRSWDQVARAALKAQETEKRAITKTADEATRAANKSAQRIQSIKERSATMAGKLAAKAATEEIREAKRAADNIARIKERSATMAGKFAAQEARMQQRAHADWVNRSQSYASAIGRGTANAAHMVMSGVGAVARTMTQLGGGFSVGDSLQEKINLERNAARLSNNAITPSGVRPDKTSILKKVRAASIATNTDEADLLAGWSAYTAKSADFEGGEKNLQFFGKLAKATDSKVSDVAKTAGILRVQNKNLNEKEMKQLLLDTVQQSRMGSVDPDELAKNAGKIARTSSSYAGSQTENQRKLLGLSQIAIRTSGSVEESATVLSNLSGDAQKHHDKITAALGKGTFNERGQIAKAPEEFIADVLDATGGNRQKIQALGFNQRSLKMFDALLPEYGEALEKGGRKGARQAVLDDMKSVTGASYDEKSMEKDFAEIMKTSAEQFEGAVRNLKQEIGDKLIPALQPLIPLAQQLIPPLTRFLEAMVGLANWAGSHPLEALTGLLIASVTKSVVDAQLGNLLKGLLSGATPGVANTAGGLANQAATGAGGGAGLAGLATGGLVMAGSAMQALHLARIADFGVQGWAQGSARVDELKKGSPEDAEAAVAQAKRDSNAFAWAQTAVHGVSRAANYMNPFAIAGQYAADKATESITGQETGDIRQIKQTFSAQKVASSSEEISAALSQAAANIRAASNEVSNASSDKRNQPMNNRGGSK